MNKLILILSLLVTGCTINSKSNTEDTRPEMRELMIGKFYGEHTLSNGNYRPWIMERYRNGKYKATFREYDDKNSFKDKVEVGVWGVSHPVYFSIYLAEIEGEEAYQSNLESPYNYDAYEIIELNNTLLKYKSFASKNIYTIKKVPNEFAFPVKK